MEKYDVVVVGGGPAANAFIIDLDHNVAKEKKIKVAQIYPSKFIKDCTGLLTKEAIDWFKSHDFSKQLDDLLDDPKISDLIYVIVNPKIEDLREYGRRSQYLYNGNREKLDNFLREKAKNVKNLQFRYVDGYISDVLPTNNGYILLTDRANLLLASKVIEATGAYAAVIKSLGITKPAIKGFGVQWFFKVRYGVEIPRDNFFVYDISGEVPYVVWITPKNRELVIGGPVSPIDGLEKIIDLALWVLKEYGYNLSKSDLYLRNILYSTATVPISKDSFIYYIRNKFNPESYVLVTGEAGRFVTPRNVNGIPYALWTGTFAAENLNNPEDYKKVVYEKLVRSKLLRKIQQAKQIYGENIKLFQWP